MNTRCLIVNADDFGLSPGVNRGVVKAHRQGIVTSASLMTRGPALEEAAALARENPRLSVGLHVDLGEWVYVNYAWCPAYEVVPLDNSEAVADAIAHQLRVFRLVMGRDPTHLDSHQHIHRSDPVRSILLQQARQLGIRLRGENPDIRYCGRFYGQSGQGYPYPEGISVQTLLTLLRHLPAGITELGCHPGEGADLNSTYNVERSIECQTLCHPLIRACLDAENIQLCSFADQVDLWITSCCP